VLRFCDLRDLQPRISFRSAQLETVQALVTHGLGLSLVPAMAVKPSTAAGPVYRSFATPRPERKIVAVWPKHRPPGRAAAALLKAITDGASPRGKT
jgi:LysR family hydrogen peroxide-inducible transcriptional activator